MCLVIWTMCSFVSSRIQVIHQRPKKTTNAHSTQSILFVPLLFKMLLGWIVFSMLCLWCYQTVSTRWTWSITRPYRAATTQMYTFLFTDHAYVHAVGMLFLRDFVFGQSVCHRQFWCPRMCGTMWTRGPGVLSDCSYIMEGHYLDPCHWYGMYDDTDDCGSQSSLR